MRYLLSAFLVLSFVAPMTYSSVTLADQEQRQDRREDRQENRQDRREDRQENRQERRKKRSGN